MIHYEVLAPPDLERIFGLAGGSIFQGEQDLAQMAFMRPSPELVALRDARRRPLPVRRGHAPGRRRDGRLGPQRREARAQDRRCGAAPNGRQGASAGLDRRWYDVRIAPVLNEPSGLSRRCLSQARARCVAGAGWPAARTRPRRSPTRSARRRQGLLGDPTAGGPVDAVGIPLARRDYPVTLPLHRRAGRGRRPRARRRLQVYNYADYLNPDVIKDFGEQEGVSVRVTTFNTLDEAFSKLPPRLALKFDVIFSAPDQLLELVGSRACGSHSSSA